MSMRDENKRLRAALPAADGTRVMRGTTDEAVLRRLWGEWLKKGLIRSWDQDRAMTVYQAFTWAWAKGAEHGSAGPADGEDQP
jgi:hypothetical protein